MAANTERGVAPLDALLLSPQQVALALGVSTRTLERWRAAGTGPAYTKIAADRIVYYGASIADWLAERTFIPEQAHGQAQEQAPFGLLAGLAERA